MRAMKDRTTGVDINIKNDVISLLYICLEKQKIELDDNYVKKYLADFFREIRDLKIIDRLDYDKKIDYIENNLDKNLDYILDNCDDLFKERFRMKDTFSINDSNVYLDVLCYVFYFDGPYQDGNFRDLLKYMHKMQRNVLKNPLRDALCFGLNS